MISPREKLAAAIIRIVTPPVATAPYFGAVLRGLIRRETPGLGTLGVTSRGVLMWDAAFVEKITVEELSIVLIHEVMHIVLKHFDRFTTLGIVPTSTADMLEASFLANIAGDLAINQELEKLGNLPAEGVTPSNPGRPFKAMPNGLMMEEYYRLLQQQVQQVQQLKQQNPGGSLPQKPQVGKGWCGSCASHALPQEPEAGKDEAGRSEADMERYRKQVAEDVKEHTEKKRGYVPGSLVRWADEYLKPPKIDWRTKLARIVRGAIAYKSGSADYTWGKMSRRQAGVGYGAGRPVLPSLHSPVPSVGVIVDTSGSVSASGLAAAASEIQGILSAIGATITVVAVDADVQAVKECRTISDALKLFKGGGGTDMSPGFEAMEKMKIRPSVIVCATDGYIGNGYPEVEPSWCKTIWVVIEGANQPCCPWGEFINVEVDA
jgi:predicted metal-dependent peptidase